MGDTHGLGTRKVWGHMWIWGGSLMPHCHPGRLRGHGWAAKGELGTLGPHLLGYPHALGAPTYIGIPIFGLPSHAGTTPFTGTPYIVSHHPIYCPSPCTGTPFIGTPFIFPLPCTTTPPPQCTGSPPCILGSHLLGSPIFWDPIYLGSLHVQGPHHLLRPHLLPPTIHWDLIYCDPIFLCSPGSGTTSFIWTPFISPTVCWDPIY